MDDEELRRTFDDLHRRLDEIATIEQEQREALWLACNKSAESIKGIETALAYIAELVQPLRQLVPPTTAEPLPDEVGEPISLRHGGTCPYCKEEIHQEAIRCKHCRSNLTVTPSRQHVRFEGRLPVPDWEGPILFIGQAVPRTQRNH